jgi:DNA-directed RNA polymerase specialized sigma24 family protein
VHEDSRTRPGVLVGLVQTILSARAAGRDASTPFSSEKKKRLLVMVQDRGQVAGQYLADQHHTETLRREKVEQLHGQGTPAPSPLQPFLDGMRDALAQLPEEDRRLLERHCADGVSLREPVDEFGLGNMSAAWKRKERILQRLRAIMQECGEVPPGW